MFYSNYYDELVSFLSGKNLFKQNEIMISNLKDYSDNDCFEILDILKILDKNDLLNQKSFARLLEITQTKPKFKNFWEETDDLYDRRIFKLLRTLIDEYKVPIKQEQLESIFNIKPSLIERLQKIIRDLHETELLNNDSFDTALKQVTRKLPAVKESEIQKTSHKGTDSPRSKLVLDNKNTLFPEADSKAKEKSGGVGTVKRAYPSLDATQPTAIIKKIDGPNKSKSIQTVKEAQREVKANRMLNRQSQFYFKKDRPHIVAEFAQGKELYEVTREELKSTSFENRIRCLASGLNDLNVLHSHYRVHGDVGSKNFMIDLSGATMRAIDFGSSHNMGANKRFPTNPAYDDPHDLMGGVYRDLWAMGIVTAQLFPELYSVKIKEDKKIEINLIKNTNLIPLEKAVIDLVNSLMKPERTSRCTSEDALNFCNKLLENINTLNTVTLEQIASSTINRSTTTVEDVIRGARRNKPTD